MNITSNIKEKIKGYKRINEIQERKKNIKIITQKKGPERKLCFEINPTYNDKEIITLARIRPRDVEKLLKENAITLTRLVKIEKKEEEGIFENLVHADPGIFERLVDRDIINIKQLKKINISIKQPRGKRVKCLFLKHLLLEHAKKNKHSLIAKWIKESKLEVSYLTNFQDAHWYSIPETPIIYDIARHIPHHLEKVIEECKLDPKIIAATEEICSIPIASILAIYSPETLFEWIEKKHWITEIECKKIQVNFKKNEKGKTTEDFYKQTHGKTLKDGIIEYLEKSKEKSQI